MKTAVVITEEDEEGKDEKQKHWRGVGRGDGGGKSTRKKEQDFV